MTVPENWKELPWENKPGLRQITPRAVVAGLAIGSIILISNFQFGLQTGWVSMMSLPSALLGFAIFKQLQEQLSCEFTDVENVFVQSIAVAVGTGPLAYGFVGVVPAIEKFLKPDESGTGGIIKFSLWQLIVWSAGLAFFGIFFAVPLRKQVVVKEKLPFPSGSATATLISVLHNTEIHTEEDDIIIPQQERQDEDSSSTEETNLLTERPLSIVESHSLTFQRLYHQNVRSLLTTFSVSSFYTTTSYFIPQLRSIPIFGTKLAKSYLWTLQPSPAYIGQGIIMGLPTVSYMLFGAILGWAVLAPLAKNMGWADGPIDDWKTGAQGWILWVSLSVMVSDSVVSFLVVTVQSAMKLYSHEATELSETEEDDDDIDRKYLVDTPTVVYGLLASSVLCVLCMVYLFGTDIVPVYSLVIAIVLALFLSVLGVRALGETDLNPVSGIGKLSQLLFALIIPKDHPGAVLVNLVAGAIAEAGAQQAGDLMQDIKTGHLIGASPFAQFIAQCIGALWSVVLSSVMYKVYDSVYEIPNDIFRIPTAVIWIDCSRLVTGAGLPPKAFEVSLVMGLIFGVISFLKNVYKKDERLVWLPSGVAVGIGIYNTPSFTIARFIGGVIAYFWMKNMKDGNKTSMIVFSSGLVLGEGMFSILNMTFTSLGVPHL